MYALLDIIDDYLDRLTALLDTDKRAWVIGGVVFLDELHRIGKDQIPLPSLVNTAFEEDDFPAVPYPFTPRDLDWKVIDEFDYTEKIFDVNEHLGLDVRLATDRRCAVGQSVSRNVLDDDTSNPTHVMLTDMEAVAVDCVALARALAAHTRYEGPALLLIEVRCDAPTPLELRAYDEDSGERLRPAAGYNFFAPMRLPFMFPLSRAEERELLWDLARDLCLQFGVFEPQLISQPIRERAATH